MVKYVIVTGGVLSGLGKGVIASSLGVIIQRLGLSVTSVKIDPYLNIDAGTMSPFEHGEVFVLDDGGEADLDLGNYERFLGTVLTSNHNITTGKVYNSVIQKERRGEYLGKTVQVVPHIVNEIQSRIQELSSVAVEEGKQPDVCIIELGGTVGDIESMPFIEALRQFQFRVGKENFVLIHVSLVPLMGEQKTKPTQQSVRELRALGLFPDFIAGRCMEPLTDETKQKISLFTHVPTDHVFSVHNVTNIYRVPLLLVEQGIGSALAKCLKLDVSAPDMASWALLADSVDKAADPNIPSVSIAFVGKYTDLQDSYQSVVWALKHAAVNLGRRLIIEWIEAEDLCDPEGSDKHTKAWAALRRSDGVLVPGGFGGRGVDGKIEAAKYARTSGKPYLGICLGLQIAVIEFARNVLGWADANSTEFNEGCEHKVVVFMPEVSKTHMGGTMRLGKRRTNFTTQNCQIAKLYGSKESIVERHRHRYEVNPDLVPQLEAKGLKFVGVDDEKTRMEILELEGHPYYVGVQFHPEFKSRPLAPSPPFVGLILACWRQQLNQSIGFDHLQQKLDAWNLK